MTFQNKPCSPSNYGGKRAETAYIVVHFTSNRGDTAENNAAYFARETVGASAHYFVDETSVWSSVPVTRVAWHCGAKTYRHAHCRNANSIGVEICMNDAKGRLRRGSIERAISLVRWLMRKYDIPADHVIRHYDVTGKHCPGPMVDDPLLWEDFRAGLEEAYLTEQEVRAIARDEYARIAADVARAPAHDYAMAAIKKFVEMGVTDGERPQAPATREEVMTMLYRLIFPTKTN